VIATASVSNDHTRSFALRRSVGISETRTFKPAETAPGRHRPPVPTTRREGPGHVRNPPVGVRPAADTGRLRSGGHNRPPVLPFEARRRLSRAPV
jgi:hypothetical protein